LGPFALDARADLLRRDVSVGDDLVVEDDDSALADGTHRQFLLERHTQFAHDDDVERGTERLGHLGRHGHASTGESDDDEVVSDVEHGGQERGEPSACIGAIGERVGRGSGVGRHRSIGDPIRTAGQCCSAPSTIRIEEAAWPSTSW